MSLSVLLEFLIFLLLLEIITSHSILLNKTVLKTFKIKSFANETYLYIYTLMQGYKVDQTKLIGLNKTNSIYDIATQKTNNNNSFLSIMQFLFSYY